MRNSIRILILSAFLCAVWASAGTDTSNAAAPQGAPKVVKRPIAFEVTNVNRSALACASDGAAYTGKGHLVEPGSGPAAAQERARGAVTPYLHDWSFGEFFWSFTAEPRYDYAAAMARAGHASVVVDRLGYGASGHPQGEQTCLGAQADVAHQIVAALRSGAYLVKGGEAHRFDRVALAGHSVGGLIASIEAFSFNDVDALLAIGHTTNVTHQAFDHFYEARVVCGQGGEPLAVGGPGGYAYIGQTDGEFEASAFHDSDPVVRAAATRLRARDPCGDSASIV